MMARVFRAGVAVILLSASSLAAEPKAVLIGPDTASVDQMFMLRFTGTISDVDVALVQATGPPVEPIMMYARDGRPLGAIVQPPESGTYIFALVAIGTKAGESSPSYSIACRSVVVGTPEPPKPPVPTDPVEKLGAAYVPAMASSHSHAWSAFADALQSGKSMKDSRTDYLSRWQGDLTAWTTANITPLMAAIITEGKEPDSTQRAALVAFARKLAAGMDSAR